MSFNVVPEDKCQFIIEKKHMLNYCYHELRFHTSKEK